jgi:Ca2+-binding RTX toxin-like protein
MTTVIYYWVPPGGAGTPFNDVQVNDTIFPGNQWNPAVASTTSGQFFVAWDEPAYHPVEGRVFRADGSAVASQFYVNTTTGNDQFDPGVTGLSNGNFVVTFSDTSVGSISHIRARLFDQNGVGAGPDFVISDGFGPETDSDAATLADGGFVVTWTRDYGGNDLDVRYRLFNADGSPRDVSHFTDASSTLATSGAQVAGLAGGGFVVTWNQNPKGNYADQTIWFQLYDKDGHEVGGHKQIGGPLASDVQVAGLKDGGFAVAYQDRNRGTASAEITLRLYDANGTERASDPNPVNTNTVANQNKPSLAILSNGFIVVGWTDDGDSKQYYQAFDAQGGRAGANASLPGTSLSGELAALSGGNVAIVTESTTSDGSGDSIRSVIADLIRLTYGDGASESLVGDSLRDAMFGDDGNDTLSGGDNDDYLLGGDGDDTLVGGAGVDQLFGDTGNDKLIGGPGVDELNGDWGDDTYYVDSVDERVDESEGNVLDIDTVMSAVSFDLTPSTTVSGNIENLMLTGTGPLTGIGNALANVITGNAFSNVLIGNGGNDTLNGDAGDDTLNGGPGVDRLVGGPGNDTYVLGNDPNVVVDSGGAADLATTTANRSMLVGGLSTVERLTLVSGNINGTGNNLANIITGSTGANIIKGGRGNDRLSGGAGNDTLYGEIGVDRLTGGPGKDNFVFNVAPTFANRDTITDFSHHDDTIKLSHSIFAGIGTGPLKSQFFFAGKHAHDADDHIIYDKATGALFYDSDGDGAHAQVLFAVIANHANAGLAPSDFVLI